MSTRKRLSSTSSFSSNSSFSSYYGGGGGDDVDYEKNNEQDDDGQFPKSLSLFDDVKIILCRHDKKLVQLEDDMNFMVDWLHKKFGFMLRNGSSSSILSDCEDDLEPETENRMLTDGSAPSSKSNTGNGGSVDGPTPDCKPIHIHNEVIAPENLEREDDADSSRGGGLMLSPLPNIPNAPPAYSIVAHDNRPPSPSSSSPISVPPAPAKPPRKRTRGPSKRKSQTPANNDEYQLPSQCDTCGKFLKDPSSLRQHKQIHLAIRPFLCPEPECGKSFRRKFHMQTHLLIHKGDKKHQCADCGRLFLLQKDLVSHERIHSGERPFQCSNCSKSFILKSHLVMHLRTHTGERPYKCEVCLKCFSQANSLRLHKKKLHLDNNPKKQSNKPTKTRSNAIKKGTKKEATAPSRIPSQSTSQLPAKLPIYKNQGISTSTRMTPSFTILQPVTSSHSYEILEHHILNDDQVIIPQSSFQLLPNTSMQMITSDILDISNSNYQI
ncbi:putative zinc finger protein [Orchesella cincta]|uniref:Putative zinc finger protein n=1 Tax=Orchesella cincta TaxID=48709 RepID=A0A1D2NGZ1_ORCCI|nr:putative zinc finger protein [Orchesella cincta]